MLNPSELKKIDAYWRASNYLAAGQLYLLDNPMLRRPLTRDDVKKKIVGHWGTVPGQNFVYVHLNRVIKKYDQDMILISGPGHGGNFFVANAYLDGTYSEVYPNISRDEEGMKKLFKQFSFPGGVPSHADHWFGVLEMAKHMGAKEVYLHCITDGRDTDPHAGKGFLADLQAKLDELGVGKIASVSGRYYAMDRDNNWDREEKAYAAFVYGEGNHAANAQEAIEASYADDKTDEFVLPCVTCEGGRVQDGDTVIFMNFRPDRARQMTRIFCDDDFKGFERRGGRKQVNYVCMAEYDATMPNCEVAYPPVELKNVLGQYLSENGKTQLRIAETEKYAHVTFFFNGGVEAPYEGEDRCVIPSPKVATYDLQPEMSAPEVAAECVKRIESGKYDVVILNFANCDMVGHTGVFDAAVKAVEAVDTAVDQVVTAVLNAGGCAFITADHGNAEKMMNPDGTPFTAHTTNVVPFVAVGCGDVKLREGGCLADIAPTMLPYIGLPVPAEMTGKSIIVE